MYICQWSLNIIYGKQKDALEIMKAWGAEKFRTSDFKKSRNNRVMFGFIGESSAHIVDEYVFDNLDDFEKALADMAQPQFQEYSKALAPFIVPASQKWTIYKVVT